MSYDTQNCNCTQNTAFTFKKGRAEQLCFSKVQLLSGPKNPQMEPETHKIQWMARLKIAFFLGFFETV